MTSEPSPAVVPTAERPAVAEILEFPIKKKRRGHARTSSGRAAGSIMPHNVIGAEQFRARSAPCITTKVSAGKRTKPRQLKAAPYERPVSLATDETPPSSSITSAVVVSSRSMASADNPNFLDSQHPNLIDTKKFGFTPCFGPMPNAGTDSEADVALRCRALVLIYGKDANGEPNNKFFAEEKIGISDTRWGNILKSGKLSRDVARQIYKAIPEITLDWLYRGKDDGMTRILSAELLTAYKTAKAEGGPKKGKAA